ncbi:hypothetical protein Tco_0310065, partial [Tanacetum coccineum]
PEGSSGNHGECLYKEKIGKEEVFEDKVDAEGVSIQTRRRKLAKYEPTVHKDPAFDDLDDAMDYMETEDAHDEGTVKDSEETKVSIDRPKVSTDEPNEGTAEPKDGNSDENVVPTTVFRDDETIARFL